MDPAIRRTALEACRRALPGWRNLDLDDVEFAPPKGFSSFTMGMRARTGGIEPRAVLYRRLEGKENAILDFETEKRIFLLLGEEGIAARCHHYDTDCRIEEFYDGRTLTTEEVFDPDVQQGIAAELWHLHQLEPAGLPEATFFELLHAKWGPMARAVLTDHRHEFPAHEAALCDDLDRIDSPETLEKVRACLPDKPPVFCHNDTYHGNVMRLDDGRIRLLDFEFSCRNHVAFDFANLFAETVMEHGFAEPPHFRIGAPRHTDADIASLVGFYLDHADLTPGERDHELRSLVAETRRCIMLSDYMYAMAALPLALEPIQRIRFLPYAHQRFARFLAAWRDEFGAT